MKTTIKRSVRLHIRKRKEWRTRAISAASAYVNRPVGMVSTGPLTAETAKCLQKLEEWHGRFARRVLMAIQRRVLS